MSIRTQTFAVLALTAAACASDSRSLQARASSPAPAPPSALVALVRLLEVVDGLREPDTWVRLRAVECDTLIDRRVNAEFVRLVLDLTVLARDLDHAYATLARLESALQAEASAGERTPDVQGARIERTFRDLDWTAEPPSGGPVFAELVSVSNSIRIEVRSGWGRVQGEEADPLEPEASLPLTEYVRRVSAGPEAGVAPLELDPFVTHPWPNCDDVRMRIAPGAPGAAFDRFQIGRFLQGLEDGSPLLRVTHIAIHPADTDPERWTFEAEIVVRETDGSLRTAGDR